MNPINQIYQGDCLEDITNAYNIIINQVIQPVPLILGINKIYCDNCLKIMPFVPNKSIDMILCDLPYGTTQNKWDTIIPFEPLWLQYKRIIKDNGAIVLTASQPFTTALIASNYEMFKYEWIWYKKTPSGVLNAKKMPMKTHENVLVFYKYPPTYNPQKTTGKICGINNHKVNSQNYRDTDRYTKYADDGTRYPTSVINITGVINNSKEKLKHPTQKPVALFEYLIKTYTNENDLVLDNCIGSGTTAIACLKTNRNFIGIELEPKYYEIANKRISEFTKQLTMAGVE